MLNKIGPLSLTSRTFFGLLLVFCLFLFASSFVLQYGFALTPCVLCLLDRILVFVLIMLYTIAFLHNPKRVGVNIYCLLGVLFSGMGIAITARHLWLLHMPHNELEVCSPGLEYLLATLPFKEAMLSFLQNSPGCTKNTGYFLGLSLPTCTMLGFTLIALGNLLPWWAVKRSYKA